MNLTNLKYSSIIIALIISSILTGCTSFSGIHLFVVEVNGEVRDNTIIRQPVKDVEIYTELGEYLGKTDIQGRFSVKVTPTKGKGKLFFNHPAYNSVSVKYEINGRYSQPVQLPTLYMRRDGVGEITGRVTREFRYSDIRTDHYHEVITQNLDLHSTRVIPGEYNLVTYRDKDWLIAELQGKGEIIHEASGGFYSIRFKPSVDSEMVISELQASGELEYILPNEKIELFTLHNVERELSNLWNMQLIGTKQAWQYSTGKGVVVAVIDTLYSTEHPDLKPNLLPPLDVFGRTEEYPPYNAHGVHVSGIIGAVHNGWGVIGVAPDVSILPVRVFNEFGSATIAGLITGIDMAVQHGAQVINLSLGTPQNRIDLHDSVKRAYQAGVVLVAASGNAGRNSLLYPAAYPEVIAVGAVDQSGYRADFSHYGTGLELMAPGVDIYSTGYGSDFVAMSGTSMAAPHVSAVAALLIAQGVTDPDYIRLVLRDTAKDMATPGYDELTGYGLLDAYAALNRFQNTYVFFGTVSVSEGVAEVKSPVLQVEVNGDYELLEILPGKGQVVGWIDVNQNLKIDPGDYIGVSDWLEIKDGMGSLSGVDIELKWLEGNFNAIDIRQMLN